MQKNSKCVKCNSENNDTLLGPFEGLKVKKSFVERNVETDRNYGIMGGKKIYITDKYNVDDIEYINFHICKKCIFSYKKNICFNVLVLLFITGILLYLGGKYNRLV
jgi:hypothetical protein